MQIIDENIVILPSTNNENLERRNVPKRQKETTKQLLKKQIEMQENYQTKTENYRKEKLRVLKEIRNSKKELIKFSKDK